MDLVEYIEPCPTTIGQLLGDEKFFADDGRVFVLKRNKFGYFGNRDSNTCHY